MKLTLRHDLGGYALSILDQSGIDGTELTSPFTLLTGPNGSGKSAVMRGMRSSMGVRGERGGQIELEFGDREIDPETAGGDVGRLAAHVQHFGTPGPAKHVPAVFDLADLGWTGQPTYLFDSRAASSIADAATLHEDLGYHVSLIVGGGKNVSHGQFVSRTWWEAIEWSAGISDVPDPWTRSKLSPARQAVRDAALGGGQPSQERWLFLDEPETAIDSEALLLGISVLLERAETGRLRVFCASHSLLFAAGLARHPKIQVVDMGGKQPWLSTQEIVLKLAGDEARLRSVGQDILLKMLRRSAEAEIKRRR